MREVWGALTTAEEASGGLAGGQAWRFGGRGLWRARSCFYFEYNEHSLTDFALRRSFKMGECERIDACLLKGGKVH
jgi:hypothetical protein